MEYIAHIGRDDDRTQLLSDHLTTVRDMCEEWGKTIGLGHVCGLAGWLHDVGKYSDKFQTYIWKAHEGSPEAIKGSVDHSSAGGIFLTQRFQQITNSERKKWAKLLAELVGNTIVAHHNPNGVLDYVGDLFQTEDHKQAILKDTLPFSDRMEKFDDLEYRETYDEIWPRFFEEFDEQQFNEYYELALSEIQSIDLVQLINNQYFYLRFVLSTLIDADHTNTADFEMQVATRKPIDSNQILKDYYKVNEKAVSQQIEENKKVTSNQLKTLNKLRQEMSDACVNLNSDHAGIYTLSVPTGGGKTLSSLRFGLNHAQRSGTERLIYIVPFTTIIEQNADVIRKRLNGSVDDSTNILEYHSAVVGDFKNTDKGESVGDSAYYYARDTWDSPIIMTSQVAYLNALFGKGSKNIRHMHRLVNSVLVFDEIQAMPMKCLGLNNLAMSWLSHEKTTSLLCTATQPALEGMLDGIKIEGEIVPDLSGAEEAFKRVEIVPDFDRRYDLSALMNLVNHRLDSVHSLLVILNTKSAVKKAYQAFEARGKAVKYHLSTSMCQKNRQYKFQSIRKNLQHTDVKKVVVFSTNLIEAGVDLSFEAVIRSATGLDSVIQAAGRCNRNHETDIAQVNLIKTTPDLENMSGLRQISDAAKITKIIAHDNTNLMTAPVIKLFFEKLYNHNVRTKAELSYPIQTVDANLDLYGIVHGDILEHDVPSQKLLDHRDQSNLEPFKTDLTVGSQMVTKEFSVIDSPTTDVIVEYSLDDETSADTRMDTDSHDIITQLLSAESKFGDISELLKEARPYTVSVYDGALKKLKDDDAICYYPDPDIWVARKSAYSPEFGLGGNESNPDDFIF